MDIPAEPELTMLLQRGFRYALALTHDAVRAEDLVQDAFVGLLGRGGPCTAAYFMTTIRNRFIDGYRREQLAVMQPLDADSGDGALRLDEPDDHVDAERLEEALATLRPQEREALYLAAVEDYTAKEIGELTGRPRNTVLSLIHRARGKLRDYFAARPQEMQG